MKKLLLFALSLGIGTMSIAQTTSISVDSYTEPSGTVYIGASSPSNIIEVSVTNNSGSDYLANEGHSASFLVTVDGATLADPDGNNWVRPMSFDFTDGFTSNFIITQSWAPTEGPGSHELCVTLVMILNGGTTPEPNMDANSKLCETYTFGFLAGIDDNKLIEISSIQTSGDIMTVFVKNAGHQAQINIMSITGQVVKTVVPSIGGQSFTENIDVSDLTAGVYIVTIQTENGISAAQKVFIQ